MARLLFSILLLHAVAAFAQPTVSGEVASEPLQKIIPNLTASPAVAIARDRTGVAIAWVMWNPENGGNRIVVARIDATLHITGAIHFISTTLAGDVQMSVPSLASAANGDGFIVAWMERPFGDSHATPRSVYCLLDTDLKQSAPFLLPTFSSGTLSSIVRSGKTTWIAAGTSAWEVQADGSLKSPLEAGMYASDMVTALDFPQLISGRRILSGTSCGCFSGRLSPCSCPINHYSYLLQFVSLYTTSASRTFSFESDAAPAIQSDGRDLMVVWFRGTQANGGDVVAMRLDPSSFTNFAHAADEPRILATFAPDVGPTRPDIATDGERYVVVWRTAGTAGHDIVGASIDRAGNVIPLSIATSLDDEVDPSVIALGSGRFLVAYEKLSYVDRRIAGRFVTFETRSHAVR